MRQIKYLNAVLSVIAFCLVMITLAITGIIPTAKATPAGKTFVQVPLNPDGTITVKFAPTAIMDVNIEKVNGYQTNLNPLPVTITK